MPRRGALCCSISQALGLSLRAVVGAAVKALAHQTAARHSRALPACCRWLLCAVPASWRAFLCSGAVFVACSLQVVKKTALDQLVLSECRSRFLVCYA